jgi:hypothetical protein
MDTFVHPDHREERPMPVLSLLFTAYLLLSCGGGHSADPWSGAAPLQNEATAADVTAALSFSAGVSRNVCLACPKTSASRHADTQVSGRSQNLTQCAEVS